LTRFRWSRQNCRGCWTPSRNMTSRMPLKNDRSAGKGAYAWKGTASRVMLVSRPKVNFWPDGSTSPGNYFYLFNCYDLHYSTSFLISCFALACLLPIE
jgi:hypothetical protein